jgi:hypothetical protein
MKKGTQLSNILRSLLILFMALLCVTGEAPSTDQTAIHGFKVSLPPEMRPFPEPLPPGRTEPGFKIRGTKGWAWAPEQYLAEIPYLAKYKMNFLMNCYLSMFTDPEKLINRWWEPIPEPKQKGYERVVKACQENGIDFCFAVHPQLFSEKPYRYDSEEDFRNLWQHYAWMQGLGVRWYSLSYDDIPMEGQDKAGLGEAHARLANKLLAKLREKDPEAELVFCPVYYMGCGDYADAKPYLTALGRTLHKDVFVFWTGDGVVATRITVNCAGIFKKIINHRVIIWDNYPVNDRHPVLHLGPVSGREPGLCEIADGYMGNPLSPQNDINRIPLLTCADYAYNPWDYDPARSIGQAVLHLADSPAKNSVLKDLVEIYPGNINLGNTNTDYNSVLRRFEAILKEPDGKKKADEFIGRVQDILDRLNREFPAEYASTKATIESHLVEMRAK